MTGIKVTPEQLNALSGQVDLQSKSIDEVAAAWVAANEPKWRAWAK
jgi:glycine betaine/proline transport system substrate-binding protein